MRRSGILLHITSLPGPGGIGTLGPEAYKFADFLKEAGMRLWQVLPCGPTGYGESPYQSSSVFAGNPLMISAEKLAADGLLTLKPEDLADDGDPERVDFERVRARSTAMLRRAYRENGERLKDEVAAFAQENEWLPDFALFTALKERYGGLQWTKWPDEALRMRRKTALAKAREELAEEIAFHSFVQYLFYRQWREFKRYCNGLGIDLFGDMPIYVAEDSADTWTHPEVFQLDKNRVPKRVAGVPPDYFSADGQLWGNPLYRWIYLRNRDYDWWVDRMRGMTRMYDLVRVDHFIGFANYWSVPYGAPNARTGKWIVGPGKELFDTLNRELPGLNIVAEDLGVVSERVKKLIAYVGYPGMRTLCFAFDGSADNIHHPNNLQKNLVYYTGTHDNDTIRSFIRQMDENSLANAKKTLHFETLDEGVKAFVKGCLDSVCDTAVVPMQDVLGLDNEARMNLPGTIGGNWVWRMLPGAADQKTAAWLRKLNKESKRL